MLVKGPVDVSEVWIKVPESMVDEGDIFEVCCTQPPFLYFLNYFERSFLSPV